MVTSQAPTLGELVMKFLAAQTNARSMEYQPEVQRFLRWCGRERLLSQLTPRQIEAYCEANRADSAARLGPLKAFLTFAHKQGLTQENLAVHAKARRRAPMAKGGKTAPAAMLTPEGYQKALAEVEELKSQRVHVAEDIRRAAADKDFRENAPLDAAREKQGHLEARIRDLEHILRHVEVAQDGAREGDNASVPHARLGARVVVFDMNFNEQMTYLLVGPREVDLRQGKISIESPTGKALMDRTPGEIVTVQAPAGVMQYRIERIES